MILGIITGLIGVIIFFINLAASTQSAIQQTVQYLGYVCASIFIVGGLIIIGITKKNTDGMNEIWSLLFDIRGLLNEESIEETQKTASNNHNKNVHESDITDSVMGDKWKCGECGTVNDIFLVSCKKCGKMKKA